MKWFAFAETVMQVFFSEVVINGKPGSVLNCEEAVLQVAEGSIDGLGFAEVRHEVGWEKTSWGCSKQTVDKRQVFCQGSSLLVSKLSSRRPQVSARTPGILSGRQKA